MKLPIVKLNPIVPKQPKLKVQPIKNKKNALTPKPGKGGGSTWMPEDPGNLRNTGGIKLGTPGAKMVDKIYKTY